MKDLHIYKAVLLDIFLSIKPCKGTKSQPKADHCLAGLDFLLRDQSYRHTASIVLEFVLEWHSYLYALYCSGSLLFFKGVELGGAFREN